MSGGAYGYFCYKDKDQVFPFKETIEEMISDMEKHSPNNPAITELKDLGALMDQAFNRIEAFHHVLHAFEWWMSGDYKESMFNDAVIDWLAKREEKASDENMRPV